jgi:hypothetical protein
MLKGTRELVAGYWTRLRAGAYYDSLYLELHAQHAFKGNTWRSHLDLLRKSVPDINNLRILDFGCGPKGGLSAELGANVTPHDPYVEKYAESPWNKTFDVVFSSDVLEHMTLQHISAFAQNIVKAHPAFVFLNISTRPAQKNLPNGANAHLTVNRPEWWLSYLGEKLGSAYQPTLAVSDLLSQDVSLCFHRENASEQKTP